MNYRQFRFYWVSILVSLSIAIVARAADVDGEKIQTPNQLRRATKVNQDLPGDIVDQSRDSKKVAELRGHLRETLNAYKLIVKKFGSGTPETRAAAHQVLEVQEVLHKQFVQEEAIPAVSQLPQ